MRYRAQFAKSEASSTPHEFEELHTSDSHDDMAAAIGIVGDMEGGLLSLEPGEKLTIEIIKVAE